MFHQASAVDMPSAAAGSCAGAPVPGWAVTAAARRGRCRGRRGRAHAAPAAGWPKKAPKGMPAIFSALTPDWRIASAIEALIDFRVDRVARWTSMVWMVPRSMVTLMFSQDSTAFRSAMRLSRSSAESGGAPCSTGSPRKVHRTPQVLDEVQRIRHPGHVGCRWFQHHVSCYRS
jgi:hypothetical protein